MKKINLFVLILAIGFQLAACKSGGSENEAAGTDATRKSEDSGDAGKTTVESTDPKTVEAARGTSSGQDNEQLGVPVFANWIHPVTHTIYDGSYDSLSHQICLCETKEVHVVDNRDIRINVNGNCFDAGDIHPLMLSMKIDSSTVFGHLAAWDTISGKIIFIGISNDTIITQSGKIHPAALHQIFHRYFKTGAHQIDRKILPYFKKENNKENEEVKRRMIFKNKIHGN